MNERSLTITIAGRNYPMRVLESEVDTVERVCAHIDQQLADYGKQFTTMDKQDLLALVAFDSLMSKHDTEQDIEQTKRRIEHRISYLNEIVSEALGSS
jgi:cell division protein ZapA